MSDARWLCLAFPIVVVACHAAPSTQTGAGTLTAANVPPGPAPAQTERLSRCPSAVTGATTIVSEVPDGVELRVTAGGDSVNEVRRRASALMAAADDTRGKHQANGGMNAQFGRCPIVMRNTKVEARDIPGGAAIVVKPWNASELGWLRREAEARTAQLAAPKPFGPGLAKACPNAVPNAETTVVDKPYGADMKVTAPTPEGARAIRERARELTSRGPGENERCPAALSEATMTTTEIPGGVSIAIKAKRPADAAAVRRDARDRSWGYEAPLTK